MSTPYIGFRNDELARLPAVRVGDRVKCRSCDTSHLLEACDDGSTMLMFYKCGGNSYLGAVNGRSVVGTKPSMSGTLGDDDE